MAFPGSREKPSASHDSSADGSESCFLEAEPTTSFKTLVSSFGNDTSQSGGKKKLSLRKLSIESANLPLNDDCSELNEEREKSLAELEKSARSAHRGSSGEEELDVSLIKSMSQEQMDEHVSQCLQLSTENKINVKNAFALKLIDCMTVKTKREDKSNFAAMACQLDAGAKIYSSRVDAVHQQVIKLVETCMYAEKKKKERGEEDDGEDGESADNPETKKKSNKAVIASNDQISRLPKEDDPRDKFVKIEALPGEILKRAKYDPKNLSLTLENQVPFWLNLQDSKPLAPEGEEIIPYIEIKDRSQRIKLDLNKEIDRSRINKLSFSKLHAGVEEEDEESNTPVDIFDSDSNDSDIENKDEEEIEMVTIAKLRMASEGSKVPSTTDVMKTIFHTPGESDYHYLKMDSHRFWAGPSHWKRPQGHNLAEAKKKAIRKKKEPTEVLYTSEEIDPKAAGGASKKATTLAKRTTGKWSVKKTTLPHDIHFDIEKFNMLFNMNIVPDIICEDSEKEKDNPNGDNTQKSIEDIFAPDDEDLPVSSLSSPQPFKEDSTSPFDPERGFQGFPSLSEAGSSSCDLEQGFRGFPSPKSGCSSPIDLEPGFRGFGSEEDLTLTTNDDAGPSSQAQEVYDGENLVPMVRTVKVEPIKFVAKPSRVDMKHLKQVMLSIIRRSIEDTENKPKEEGEQSHQGSVLFKDVIVELFQTDKLHSSTREDLTVPMAVLAVLDLAGENNLSLKTDPVSKDFHISYAPDV